MIVQGARLIVQHVGTILRKDDESICALIKFPPDKLGVFVLHDLHTKRQEQETKKGLDEVYECSCMHVEHLYTQLHLQKLYSVMALLVSFFTSHSFISTYIHIHLINPLLNHAPPQQQE